MPALLEHANITVSDPTATAAWMEKLFGWHIRWQGDAIMGGRTIHIGTDDQYLALYTPGAPEKATQITHATLAGLNHIGVVVDDITATEAAVKQHGFEPHNHADYEPGVRFYFMDADGIDYEVVQYG
jgi:catechol 2,3-dioxygenase-like lactoylglutathione lyase family enzyme